jgi:hypothetical protein
VDKSRKGLLSPVSFGYCVIFKVREEARHAPTARDRSPASGRRRAGLSKLNSMRPPRRRLKRRRAAWPDSVDISSGRPVLRPSPRRTQKLAWRANPPDDDPWLTGAPGLKGLPRKEVIQPQLPLRLPCYDFTPVANPTFDGSFPCGLGHRLRVLLTPMV